MRIGYGYKRNTRDFEKHEVDRVWLDTKSSERSERIAMMHLGLVEGDTLVLLDVKDLGRPYKPLVTAIEGQGVTIEAHDPVKAPNPRGAPLKFNPTPDQDKQIKAMWMDWAYEGSYVVRRASEIMGMEVKRHHLIHRYGKRGMRG